TLVYFHPSEEELYLSAFRSLGLDVDPGALRLARRAAWQEYLASTDGVLFDATEDRDLQAEVRVMAETLARCGVHDLAQAELALKASKAVFKTPGAVRLYDEVLDVIAALGARGVRLGIVSNWSWDLRDYVELVGIERYFDVVVASAHAGCEKPHPGIFARALQAAAVEPARALHVGDSYEADVLGARAAGMDALWLDRAGAGGHPDCPSIRDLSALLELV
ncbi:MAG: HAD-IA family hydrolase, partial [Anaerolineae bacterium]|nr:HAD-IA family hydrolase [Anaerolineae bacterium]